MNTQQPSRPVITPAMREQAKKQPNTWLYVVDPIFSDPNAEVPPWGFIGGYRVDERGELTDDFSPNPNYRPSPVALRLPAPTNDVERALQLTTTGYAPAATLLSALLEAELILFAQPQGSGLFTVDNDSGRKQLQLFTSDKYLPANWTTWQRMTGRQLVEHNPAGMDLQINPTSPVKARMPAEDLIKMAGMPVQQPGPAQPAADATRPAQPPAAAQQAPDPLAGDFGQRFLGSVLSAAVGDALGAPVEFYPIEQIRGRFGERGVTDYDRGRERPGEFTDDTQLVLFTLEGLVRAHAAARGGAAGDPLSAVQLAYQRWLHTQGYAWSRAAGPYAETHPEPDGWLLGVRELFAVRSPNSDCITALREFAAHGKPGTFDEPVNDSDDNTGVVRAAPFALWSEDPREVFRMAAAAAALTCGKPSGYLPAGVLAVLVHRLLRGTALPEALGEARALLAECAGHQQTERLLLVAEDLAAQGRPTPEQIKDLLGGGWSGHEALAIAVCAALSNDGIGPAVMAAVNHSGDSDTTGAICGAIVGARYGASAVPGLWLRDLAQREAVQSLVTDALVEFGPQPRADEGFARRYPGQRDLLPLRFPGALPKAAGAEAAASAGGAGAGAAESAGVAEAAAGAGQGSAGAAAESAGAGPDSGAAGAGSAGAGQRSAAGAGDAASSAGAGEGSAAGAVESAGAGQGSAAAGADSAGAHQDSAAGAGGAAGAGQSSAAAAVDAAVSSADAGANSAAAGAGSDGSAEESAVPAAAQGAGSPGSAAPGAGAAGEGSPSDAAEPAAGQTAAQESSTRESGASEATGTSDTAKPDTAKPDSGKTAAGQTAARESSAAGAGTGTPDAATAGASQQGADRQDAVTAGAEQGAAEPAATTSADSSSTGQDAAKASTAQPDAAEAEHADRSEAAEGSANSAAAAGGGTAPEMVPTMGAWPSTTKSTAAQPGSGRSAADRSAQGAADSGPESASARSPQTGTAPAAVSAGAAGNPPAESAAARQSQGADGVREHAPAAQRGSDAAAQAGQHEAAETSTAKTDAAPPTSEPQAQSPGAATAHPVPAQQQDSAAAQSSASARADQDASPADQSSAHQRNAGTTASDAAQAARPHQQSSGTTPSDAVQDPQRRPSLGTTATADPAQADQVPGTTQTTAARAEDLGTTQNALSAQAEDDRRNAAVPQTSATEDTRAADTAPQAESSAATQDSAQRPAAAEAPQSPAAAEERRDADSRRAAASSPETVAAQGTPVAAKQAAASRPAPDAPGLPADQRAERILGCLLGGALGDALGHPVAQDSIESIRRDYGGAGVVDLVAGAHRAGAITAHTQLALFTTEGLIRASVRRRMHGDADPVRPVQLAYQRWLHTQGHDWQEAGGPDAGRRPDGWLVREQELFAHRSPDPGCVQALREYAGGAGSGTPVERRNDSKSCSGVVRAAPAGFTADDPAEAFRVGASVAALTHGHPSGFLPAGALAVVVAELLRGRSLTEAVDAALCELATWDGHEETTAALRRAIELATEGTPTPEQIQHRLGSGAAGEEALAIAVCAALARPSSFTDSLVLAANHSGAGDATAAICGAIMGAARGASAIPAAWRQKLELHEVVEQLARDAAEEFGEHPPTVPEWLNRYPAGAAVRGDAAAAGRGGSGAVAAGVALGAREPAGSGEPDSDGDATDRSAADSAAGGTTSARSASPDAAQSPAEPRNQSTVDADGGTAAPAGTTEGTGSAPASSGRSEDAPATAEPASPVAAQATSADEPADAAGPQRTSGAEQSAMAPGSGATTTADEPSTVVADREVGAAASEPAAEDPATDSDEELSEEELRLLTIWRKFRDGDDDAPSDLSEGLHRLLQEAFGPERAAQLIAGADEAGPPAEQPAPLAPHDRLTGCALGTAAGDALAAPWTYAAVRQILRRQPDGVRELLDGSATALGQQQVFVLDGLIRAAVHERLHGESAAAAAVRTSLQQWAIAQGASLEPARSPLAEHPALRAQRFPDEATLAALGGWDGAGEPPTPATPPTASAGPAAAVRGPLLGLRAGTPAEAVELGIAVGVLTHGHPDGYLPAAAAAAITCAVREGQTLAEAVQTALTELKAWEGGDATLGALRRAVELAEQGPVPVQALESAGTGWDGPSALGIAVAAALAHPESFTDAVALAATHSGNSAATAALCGGLLGAARGPEAVPQQWRERLELGELLADLLADAARAEGELTGDGPVPEWAQRYTG